MIVRLRGHRHARHDCNLNIPVDVQVIALPDVGDYIEAWNKDAVEQKYNDMLRDFNEINDLLF